MSFLSTLCATKIEIYHHHEQNRTSLKSIYRMQEVFIHDKFLFFDFAARKRNLFSRPGAGCTNMVVLKVDMRYPPDSNFFKLSKIVHLLV